MRESNFRSVPANRASVTISSTIYDRRALDCKADRPLVNSLSHLTYLASSSARVRETLCVDGGLERLICILKECRDDQLNVGDTLPNHPEYGVGYDPGGAPSEIRRAAIRERTVLIGWKWTLALQCLTFLGTRGSEEIRRRVAEAGLIPIIATILDNFLYLKDKQQLMEKARCAQLAARSRAAARLSQTAMNPTPTEFTSSTNHLRAAAQPSTDTPHPTPRMVTRSTSSSASIPADCWSSSAPQPNPSSASAASLPQRMATLEAAPTLHTLPSSHHSLPDASERAARSTSITSAPLAHSLLQAAASPAMAPAPHIHLHSQASNAVFHTHASAPVHNHARPHSHTQQRQQLGNPVVDNVRIDDSATRSVSPEYFDNSVLFDARQQQPRLAQEPTNAADPRLNINRFDDNDDASSVIDVGREQQNVTADGALMSEGLRLQSDALRGMRPTAPAVPDFVRMPESVQVPAVAPLTGSAPRAFYNHVIVALQDDVIWSLEILAFVSKYASLKDHFQLTHLVPDISVRDPNRPPLLSEARMHARKEAACGPVTIIDDMELDNPVICRPNAVEKHDDWDYDSYDFEADQDVAEEYLGETINVFPLVEKFTLKLFSKEVTYWAGVIMRNSCRKDEGRGGIRQCANFECGTWETRPRQFAKCRRCKRTKYCSKECQLVAWTYHKNWCLPSGTSSSSSSTSSTSSSSVSRHHHHHQHHQVDYSQMSNVPPNLAGSVTQNLAAHGSPHLPQQHARVPGERSTTQDIS